MVGEPEGHRRGAPLVAAAFDGHGKRVAEGEVRTEPVVREQRHAEERIPGGAVFGERVGLAGEAAQAVAQRPVEPLEIDGVGERGWRAAGRAHLDPGETPWGAPSVILGMLLAEERTWGAGGATASKGRFLLSSAASRWLCEGCGATTEDGAAKDAAAAMEPPR